jgi:hypothetical protein
VMLATAGGSSVGDLAAHASATVTAMRVRPLKKRNMCASSKRQDRRTLEASVAQISMIGWDDV